MNAPGDIRSAPGDGAPGYPDAPRVAVDPGVAPASGHRLWRRNCVGVRPVRRANVRENAAWS